MLTRYSIFNTITAFAILYAIWFHDAIGFLWTYDQTRFSFVITGIYILITLYIGVMGVNVNVNLVHFVSNRLTSIGLIGTVVGMMILMHTVGGSHLTNVADVVAQLFLGMSTVLITTAFGMLFSLLSDFQMTFVFGAKPK